MNSLPIAKEALPYAIVFLIISVIFYLIFPPLSLIGIIFLLFVLYFFRNPDRVIPQEKGTIVSPADGVVMNITELDEPEFINGKAKKVTIFLSIFNVHINRAPISGIVKYTAYRPGKYLPAYKSHASDLNERNTIGIQGEHIRVIVHQITGFIARRIVCWVKKEQPLEKGQRYGLIKFGSCTEIIVPANVTITVAKGQKVKGGKSVIGVIDIE